MKEELTRIQFDILEQLESDRQGLSQERLASMINKELLEVQKAYAELEALGLIKGHQITERGIEKLEPYRVKRAIFIAAGFGSRLVPVTINTPKPLVRVKGTRMIDTMIDAVLAAGIEEIVIVRGYLLEQFDQLLYKYPMIRFVDNLSYSEANNLFSVLRVRNLLENAYVFEADLYLSNPGLIKKYHYASNFLGIRFDKTEDWCFEVKDGVIVRQKVGGVDCYQEIGISYWDKNDGKKLAGHIEEACDTPEGKMLYWDQVPLLIYRDEYQVEIRECSTGDVIEIDTFNELRAIDDAYNFNSEI